MIVIYAILVIILNFEASMTFDELVSIHKEEDRMKEDASNKRKKK